MCKLCNERESVMFSYDFVKHYSVPKKMVFMNHDSRQHHQAFIASEENPANSLRDLYRAICWEPELKISDKCNVYVYDCRHFYQRFFKAETEKISTSSNIILSAVNTPADLIIDKKVFIFPIKRYYNKRNRWAFSLSWSLFYRGYRHAQKVEFFYIPSRD